MGKVRTKIIGSVEEQEQKKKDSVRREAKKTKKVKAPGSKGGERLPQVGPTEEELEITAKTVSAESAADKTPQKIQKTAKKKKFAQKKPGRRYFESIKLIDQKKLYDIESAVKLLKTLPAPKFTSTVELHLNVAEKGLRGSVKLPHGTGKKIRVAVADDQLLEQISQNKIDFDILIAHPSMMSKLAKTARLLGPKGLMPNPKTGTIAEDTAKRKKELEEGEVHWKTESGQPLLHLVCGRVNFSESAIIDNIKAYINSIGREKIKKAVLKSTMSPGIKLNITTLF